MSADMIRMLSQWDEEAAMTVVRSRNPVFPGNVLHFGGYVVTAFGGSLQEVQFIRFNQPNDSAPIDELLPPSRNVQRGEGYLSIVETSFIYGESWRRVPPWSLFKITSDPLVSRSGEVFYLASGVDRAGESLGGHWLIPARTPQWNFLVRVAVTPEEVAAATPETHLRADRSQMLRFRGTAGYLIEKPACFVEGGAYAELSTGVITRVLADGRDGEIPTLMRFGSRARMVIEDLLHSHTAIPACLLQSHEGYKGMFFYHLPSGDVVRTGNPEPLTLDQYKKLFEYIPVKGTVVPGLDYRYDGRGPCQLRRDDGEAVLQTPTGLTRHFHKAVVDVPLPPVPPEGELALKSLLHRDPNSDIARGILAGYSQELVAEVQTPEDWEAKVFRSDLISGRRFLE